MRQPLVIVRGTAAPLPLTDIDTDVIIRIDRLTQDQPGGLGSFAFESLRYDADGRPNSDFPFNQPRWREARILIAGANFGCGSSREPAVTALIDMGLRCVIATSFGDIFYANCFQNGLLPIRLPNEVVTRLLDVAARVDEPWEVDLDSCLVLPPEGAAVSFEIDENHRDSLMTGLDDIGLTLRDLPTIADWQAADRVARPWMWQSVARETSR